MGRLTILRRQTTDTTTKDGLGRYADSVEKCLKEEGIDFDAIPFDINLCKGYARLFVHGFVKPLIAILRSRPKDRIVHATDELCGIFFPLIRGKKILTVHHVIKRGEYRGNLYYAMWMIAATISIRSADKVIAISESTKDEVLRRFKADSEKVVCILNGVNDIFHVENVEKESMIGCIGMLIPRKNTSSAIIAFKMLSDCPDMSEYFLEICGRGPEKEKLLGLAKTLSISDKVRFVSDLSDSEIVSFYNRSVLLFNTSLHEGMGFATIEAQRCGIPVLHLENAKIPKEVTKLSIPCRDEAEMAEKSYGLLKDKEEYERIAGASREYADRFGGNYCRRYIEAINELR